MSDLLSDAAFRAQVHTSAVEQAGRTIHQTVHYMLGRDLTGRSVMLLAGPGLTGAAGIAAARRLHQAGTAVRLVLSRHPETLHSAAAAQATLATEEGIAPWYLGLSQAEMDAHPPLDWTAADLLVDALLGSGLVGDPREEMADLIHLINTARRPVLAVDVPSGLVGDEGWIHSPCVDATATLIFDTPRNVHREGWPVVGALLLGELEQGHVSPFEWDTHDG